MFLQAEACAPSQFEFARTPGNSGSSFQREDLYLDSTILFVVLGVAGISATGQRIIPTIADDFEFVGIKFVFVHDRPANSVSAVIGKLADQVGGDDTFAAGVSIAFDDDVCIAELARELSDFFKSRWNRGIVIRV